MKKSVFILFILSAFWFACQAEGESKGTTEQRLTKIEEELSFLKKALEYKGLDLNQIREEMDQMEKVHNIPLEDSPVIGPENAKVTIVEFSDFQCPYCAQRATMVKAIQEKYPNDVRVIFKHFPLSFHTKAPPAHAASMAAQAQGKFWEFRYALAPEYRDLSDEKILEVAQKIGLDMEKFKAAYKIDAEEQKKIERDIALGTQIGVRGTPTFFVNGKYARGFSPQMVDELLKK